MSNTLPLLTGPGEGGLEGAVTEMAVHAAAVLLCGKGGVLEPLRNLAFFPDSMAVRWVCHPLSQERRWPFVPAEPGPVLREPPELTS